MCNLRWKERRKGGAAIIFLILQIRTTTNKTKEKWNKIFFFYPSRLEVSILQVPCLPLHDTHTHTNQTFCFSRIKKKIDQLSEGGRTSQHTHLQQTNYTNPTKTVQNSLPLLKIFLKKSTWFVAAQYPQAVRPHPRSGPYHQQQHPSMRSHEIDCLEILAPGCCSLFFLKNKLHHI